MERKYTTIIWIVQSDEYFALLFCFITVYTKSYSNIFFREQAR
jgi:hypothetical protein